MSCRMSVIIAQPGWVVDTLVAVFPVKLGMEQAVTWTARQRSVNVQFYWLVFIFIWTQLIALIPFDAQDYQVLRVFFSFFRNLVMLLLVFSTDLFVDVVEDFVGGVVNHDQVWVFAFFRYIKVAVVILFFIVKQLLIVRAVCFLMKTLPILPKILPLISLFCILIGPRIFLKFFTNNLFLRRSLWRFLLTATINIFIFNSCFTVVLIQVD